MKKRRDNEYHTTAMKTMKLWMMAAILTAAAAKIQLTAEGVARLEALADATGIDTRGGWEHSME